MLTIQNMLGLGDNLHSRPIVREMASRGPVQVMTPWPCLFHDIEGVRFIQPHKNLRTQTKNANREADAYSKPLRSDMEMRVWYSQNDVRRHGGFIQAMCETAGVHDHDFSLTIPQAWLDKADAILDGVHHPVMIYRPLVERTEWIGCNSRNPDEVHYTELAEFAGRNMHIISIADTVPSVEWIVSRDIGADMEYHSGELDIETISGLVYRSSLVFCSPGFMLILAQALRRKMIAVFGGHESARLYDHGFDTDLFIQPVNPCECFSKTHSCDKSIDIEQAKASIHDHKK